MAEAADKATNGSPMANQVLGIHVMGFFFGGGLVSTQSILVG
jgi:hypothetical protein